jgi:4-amino-4-deoxychorismate lyase
MVTYLLKKSYQRRDLKEIKFNDLWDSNGLFTTMWIFGKPPRILFFKKHIDNLIKSLKVYKLNETNVKRNIIKLINSNLKRNKKYNHLLRVAINNKTISVSLRKKVKIKRKFKLRLLNYKRIKPEYKNLKYKKLLKHLSKLDPSTADIGLCVNNRILESATSNILFVSNNKIYSPIDKFYKGTTFKSLEKKIGRIFKKDIFISALKTYDEIILIGSGKGVVSINNIDNFNWSRKSSKTYRYLLRIYQEAVTNCPRYYS